MAGIHWKEKDLQYIKDNYPNGKKEDILKSLPNRTWQSIQITANRIGLKRENIDYKNKIVDIVGNKYGKLTVLSFSSLDKYNKSWWNCVCECGKEKIIPRHKLTNEETPSCGIGICSGYVQDITGNKFGKITVLSLNTDNGKYTHWNCICDCGNDKIIMASSLRAQYTTSCGCEKKFLSQKKLFRIMKEIFPNLNIKYEYDKFNWLKNNLKNGKRKSRQQLDIYIPEIKLAIEYDGRQHFEPVCFGNISKEKAKKKLKQQKKWDKIKNEKIKNNTDDIKYFIRIPYTEKLEKENIVRILKKNRVPIKE